MNRIKELRQKKNLTQDALGKLLNVQKSAISKYETGKVPLTDDMICRMTKIFDVTSDFLLGLSNEPKLSYWETKITSLDSESLSDLEKYLNLLALREAQEKDLPDKKSGTSNTSKSSRKSVL